MSCTDDPLVRYQSSSTEMTSDVMKGHLPRPFSVHGGVAADHSQARVGVAVRESGDEAALVCTWYIDVYFYAHYIQSYTTQFKLVQI